MHTQQFLIQLASPEISREFGLKLGAAIEAALRRNKIQLPFLITLSGEIGAGKTTLCQAICEALGIAETGEIVSPTFTLANEHHGCLDIFHLDIYRLDNQEQFYDAGLDEYLGRNGICLLEWPEKMPKDFWPENRLALALEFKNNGRRLSSPLHPVWDEFLKLNAETTMT